MTTIDLRHVTTPEQAKAAMDKGLADVPRRCRWCRGLVCAGLPCSCERAQRELASIRAGMER